jgi:hypothetical protein
VLPIEVVEVDASHSVPGRGHVHDAPDDVAEQQVGQGEVAEMVGTELQLEAVGSAGEWCRHHSGVVDQQVQVAVPARGELADRGQAREVEPADLGVAGHRRGGSPALVGIAHGENDAGARAGERTGGGAADAAVAAGDDHAAAGHVGDVCGVCGVV